jgi:purine operon repressor
MDKLAKNERIALILKVLTENPGEIHTLGSFTGMLGSAKSTTSEDIDVVQGLLKKFDMGYI